MKEGDIILVAMGQADNLNKRRPALVLRRMPKFGDLLICGISSQMHQAIPRFDAILARESPEFAQTGLVTSSVVRLGFLNVISINKASGVLGSVGQHLHVTLLERLCRYLRKGDFTA
ncbi:mRNA interferase MazF [Desulfonatronum zhilinae]|nr:mRNA interferase MazF [Desulfonatronum zhilinae]